MSTTTVIGLIRHSLTLWNEEQRIQGQADSPLSARGRSMAISWGEELAGFHWDRLLCSDLERAQATAALVNRRLRLPCHRDSDLREQDWGRWTGQRLARLRQEQPTLIQAQVERGWGFQPPGGESRRQILARAEQSLHRAAERWPGQRVLVVCHEGVIKCLLYRLSKRAFLPEEPRLLRPYHLHLLRVDQGCLSLGGVNHHSLEVA
ncbi:histidine phosphatase family protein [Desulfogranum mediterraneum]|uniref:histidine phosphatase family protein n=1 Tax=Desulfogranum mediterraneum TaxID=160661 RepID=UPI0004077296|nr:histidine phosphatase family protein [Desulfogranum mediterraneum]